MGKFRPKKKKQCPRNKANNPYTEFGQLNPFNSYFVWLEELGDSFFHKEVDDDYLDELFCGKNPCDNSFTKFILGHCIKASQEGLFCGRLCQNTLQHIKMQTLNFSKMIKIIEDYELKTKSSIIIQRQFRKSCYNPEYRLCRDIMRRKFAE